VIQTYRPEHFAIRAASEQDFDAFFERELQYRKNAGYPPSLCLMVIRLHSPLETAAERAGADIARYIKETFIQPYEDLAYAPSVYGPTVDGTPKINYVYRKRVLVKASYMSQLTKIRDALVNKFAFPVLNESRDLEVNVMQQEERNHFKNHTQNVLLEFDVTGA